MPASTQRMAAVRAAWWTLRALIVARRELRSGQFDRIKFPSVPQLPPSAIRGVTGVLSRVGTTCLEQATIRQAWHAAQGSYRDLVIGVTAPSLEFQAHAWLDGDPPCHSETFQELLRRRPQT